MDVKETLMNVLQTINNVKMWLENKKGKANA